MFALFNFRNHQIDFRNHPTDFRNHQTDQNLSLKDWPNHQIEAFYHHLYRFYRFQIKPLHHEEFDLIKDLIQDVFLRILERESQLKEKRYFKTWCFKIAIRQLYLHQKRVKKEVRVRQKYQAIMVDHLSDQSQMIEMMIFNQKLAVLYRCIDRLPHQHRLLVYQMLNEEKVEVLSEKWGLSVACLKSRYHTAKIHLKSLMTAIDSFYHFLVF
jgi:RNA polymerase sigma factor (sigma-70 family)